MNQASDDQLDEIGSLSSSSLELPPAGSQDEEGANNNTNDADPTEESNEEQVENPEIRDRTQPIATDKVKKTNIESRLTQAHRAYVRDPTRQRSQDVSILTTKFRNFREHLEEMLPLIQTYQRANKELQSARSQLYANIADISVESPLYDKVGKKLDANALSEAKTTEAGAEGAEQSQTQSMMSVHQVAQAPQSVLEAEYQEELVGYIMEWQEAVANKVDKLMQANSELRVKQQHYRAKVDKLQEEKFQSEVKGKEFGGRKTEKLVRNVEKHGHAMSEHEEKASEVCHMLESVVNMAWLDMMPLVQQTIAWEAKRYDNDDVSYADMFRPVLKSLNEEILRIEEEETAEDMGAALSIQKEKNEVLKEKLNRLQMAISGDWETKKELFGKFDLM